MIRFLWSILLLLLCGLVPTIGKAQFPTGYQNALPSYASKINGGAYSYIYVQSRSPRNNISIDTVTVYFFHDPITDTLQFYCKSRGKVTSYINGKYGVTDLQNHVFKYSYTNQQQAISRNGKLIKTYLTRGKTFKDLLTASHAEVVEKDTVIKNEPMCGIHIRSPYPFLPDSFVSNLNNSYYVDRDSILRYAIETYSIPGTTISNTCVFLKWSFDDDIIEKVKEELTRYHHALDSLGYQMIEESSLLNERPKLLEVGTKAPPITGITTEGGKLDVQKIPAKLYLLEFSFAGCEPCLRMAEPLERIYKEYGNKGLAVISLDPMDDLTIIKDLSERLNTTYLHLQIPPETADDYHVSGYPTIYLLDSNFQVVVATQGFGSTTTETLEQSINRQFP